MNRYQINRDTGRHRRFFSRFDTYRNVELQFDGQDFGRSQIENVSLTGARLLLKSGGEIPEMFEIADPVINRIRSVRRSWISDDLVGISYVSPFETIGDLLHYRLSLYATCKLCGHSDWVNLQSLSKSLGNNFVCTEVNLQERLRCKRCKTKQAPLSASIINRNCIDLRDKRPTGFRWLKMQAPMSVM